MTLDEAMRQKQATNEALAAKAGVCSGTVHKVRNGIRVTPFLERCIWAALAMHNFKYNKRGPKRR